MKRDFLVAFSAIVFFGGPGPASGYELTTVRELESDTPITVIVSEFYDKDNLDNGETTAFIMWREAFGALRDMRGSAVRLALDENRELSLPPTTQQYHFAARQSAEKYNGNTGVWGVVKEMGSDFLVWCYVSVLSNVDSEKLSATLTVPESDFAINLRMPRKSFTFGPYLIPKEDVLSRRYVVRIAAKVFATQNNEGEALSNLQVGRVVESSSQNGKWIKFDADDVSGYVEIWYLDILPIEVRAGAKPVSIKEIASRKSQIKATLPPGTTAAVTRSKLVGPDRAARLWYEVSSGAVTGWASKEQFESRHLLPSNHFVAALVRFQAGQFSVAKAELEAFLFESGSSVSNTNEAFALQLSALSILLQDSDLASSEWNRAFELLSKAILLTPFDPAAYRLRAASAIGDPDLWTYIAGDLRQALELDELNADTHDQIQIFLRLFQSELKVGSDRVGLHNAWIELRAELASLANLVRDYSLILQNLN